MTQGVCAHLIQDRFDDRGFLVSRKGHFQFVDHADEALVLEDSTTIGRRIPSLVVVTLALVALGVAGTIKWR